MFLSLAIYLFACSTPKVIAPSPPIDLQLSTFPILDDESSPHQPRPSLDRWVTDCGAAVDWIETHWKPKVRTDFGADIYLGRLPNQGLVSTMWVQEFSISTPTHKAKILSMYNSPKVGEGVEEWDSTFLGADLLATAKVDSQTSLLVSWRYRAPPLAARELIYLVHQQQDSSSVTVGYPSVSKTWVTKHWNITNWSTGFVRSKNMFPSCDRIQIIEGGTKLRIAHLMTTDVGGWFSPVIVRLFLQKTLLSTYIKEAKRFQQHVSQKTAD